MRPIAEYAPMYRLSFEREILAKGEPWCFAAWSTIGRSDLVARVKKLLIGR